MFAQESDDSSTPKNCKGRKLGLRRSVRRNQIDNHESNTQATPIPKIKDHHQIGNNTLIAPSGSVTCSKLSSSLHLTPHTPTPCEKTALERLAHSTNGRPYRLTLNKRIRDKLTKKRLEFHLSSGSSASSEACEQNTEQLTTFIIDTDATSVPQSQLDIRSKLETMSKQEIIDEMRKHQPDIEGYVAHAKKVQELKEAIETWKKAFQSSFQDLHEKIEPKIERVDLLKRLGIPIDMLQYVDDEDEL